MGSSIDIIKRQIRERVRDLEGIVSLAIFGSAARRENIAESDVDLLVVAEGIPGNVIQRIPDMVNIERKLDLDIPLDILLVSKDECCLNFRNHNPLYLDIALDAEIIYDEADFLRNLIEETREYVDSRNIRRGGPGSWSFPVKERTAAKLSGITSFFRWWFG